MELHAQKKVSSREAKNIKKDIEIYFCCYYKNNICIKIFKYLSKQYAIAQVCRKINGTIQRKRNIYLALNTKVVNILG